MKGLGSEQTPPEAPTRLQSHQEVPSYSRHLRNLACSLGLDHVCRFIDSCSSARKDARFSRRSVYDPAKVEQSDFCKLPNVRLSWETSSFLPSQGACTDVTCSLSEPSAVAIIIAYQLQRIRLVLILLMYVSL